jgi:hypothetical protein
LKRSGIALFGTRLAVRYKAGGVGQGHALDLPPASAFRYHQGYFSASESFFS